MSHVLQLALQVSTISYKVSHITAITYHINQSIKTILMYHLINLSINVPTHPLI